MRGAMRSLILLLLTAGSSIAAFLADRILPGGNRAERVMGGGAAPSFAWGVEAPGRGDGEPPVRGPSWWRTIRAPWTFPMLLSAFPRPVRFLAKRETGGDPAVRKAMARRGTSSSTGTTRGTWSGCSGRPGTARDGRLVVVFPEGTRSGDGSIGEFRPGAFYLAQKSGAPVVRSTSTAGTGRSPRGFRVHPAELLVRALPPLSPGKGAGGSKERIAAAVRARIPRGPRKRAGREEGRNDRCE